MVLGALGLLIVAKSCLVLERLTLDGNNGDAIAATPTPPRDEPLSLPFLAPEAGPAPANDLPTPAAPAAAAETAVQDEPRQFSATELELLGMLDERRAALDEREQRLDLRAAMLETARAKLAEQLEELKALQASITA